MSHSDTLQPLHNLPGKSKDIQCGLLLQGVTEPKHLRDLRRRLGKEAHRPGATPEARREWRACVRAISNVNKRAEKSNQLKTTQFQEQRYRKDFFWFAKSAIKGTLGKTPGTVKFTKEVADTYYPSTYSTTHTINRDQLGWIP